MINQRGIHPSLLQYILIENNMNEALKSFTFTPLDFRKTLPIKRLEHAFKSLWMQRHV